jgi:hypothetical protein
LVQNTLTALSQGDGEGGICSTHSIGKWVVIEKKKKAYGIMNTKKEVIFGFHRRKERKGKENVCFLHPALFF